MKIVSFVIFFSSSIFFPSSRFCRRLITMKRLVNFCWFKTFLYCILFPPLNRKLQILKYHILVNRKKSETALTRLISVTSLNLSLERRRRVGNLEDPWQIIPERMFTRRFIIISAGAQGRRKRRFGGRILQRIIYFMISFVIFQVYQGRIQSSRDVYFLE